MRQFRPDHANTAIISSGQLYDSHSLAIGLPRLSTIFQRPDTYLKSHWNSNSVSSSTLASNCDLRRPRIHLIKSSVSFNPCIQISYYEPTQPPILSVENLPLLPRQDEGRYCAPWKGGTTSTTPARRAGHCGLKSGCGKNVTARSILRIVEAGRIEQGNIWLQQPGLTASGWT